MIDEDRRKAIVEKYITLPHMGPKTDRCVRFIKHTCRCRSLSHFLDTAKESNVERLERMLCE